MRIDRVPDVAKYLSAVFLVAWFGRNTVWNFLPLYLERHMSIFLVGLATSLPPAVTVLMDMPVGSIVQRSGGRIVTFVGISLIFASPVLYLFTAPVMLILGKAFEGLSKVFMWNGGWSLSLGSSDQEVESETASVLLLGPNIAYILAPVIGGLLIASRGFDITFVFWALSSLVAILLYLRYIGIQTGESLHKSVSGVLSRDTYAGELDDLRMNWNDLKLPLVLVLLYYVIFSFYWVAVPLLLESVASGRYVVMGAVFGLAALPKLFQYLFGDLADRFGEYRTVLALGLCLIPVLFLMSTLSGPLAVGAVFLLARVFSAGMSPALHGMFNSAVPDRQEGEMVGFLELFKHLGQAIGPALAGAVAAAYGVSASFIAAALISTGIVFVSALGLRTQ